MKKLSGWQVAGLVAGIGCLSIVGVLVLGVVVAVMWARSAVAELGDTTPTPIERTIGLEPPAAAVQDGSATAGGQESGEPLRLTVDLEEGSFVIRPGAPDGQVQIEGTYAPGLYELTEDHETDDAGRTRGTTIRFRSKAPFWARMLSGIGSDSSGRQPNLTVLIPEGAPIVLSLRVSMGESRVDLGGLTLRELDLDLSMGEHRVDFGAPLVEELRRVRLDASMGNVSVNGLGNARPRIVEATGNMGNVTADLGGAWQPGGDAELSFAHSMGELTLRVPRAVRLESNVSGSQGQPGNGRGGAAETDDPDAPVVRLRLSTSMGESRVVRY